MLRYLGLFGSVLVAGLLVLGAPAPPATTGAAPLAQATATPTATPTATATATATLTPSATPTNTPTATPTATPRAAPNWQRIDQPDGGVRCYWYEEDRASMSCVVVP